MAKSSVRVRRFRSRRRSRASSVASLLDTQRFRHERALGWFRAISTALLAVAGGVGSYWLVDSVRQSQAKQEFETTTATTLLQLYMSKEAQDDPAKRRSMLAFMDNTIKSEGVKRWLAAEQSAREDEITFLKKRIGNFRSTVERAMRMRELDAATQDMSVISLNKKRDFDGPNLKHGIATELGKVLRASTEGTFNIEAVADGAALSPLDTQRIAALRALLVSSKIAPARITVIERGAVPASSGYREGNDAIYLRTVPDSPTPIPCIRLDDSASDTK